MKKKKKKNAKYKKIQERLGTLKTSHSELLKSTTWSQRR